MEKTCTATQLIARLQQLVEQHGDLPVYAVDADTELHLPIGLTHEPARQSEPEKFLINTSYHSDRPEGGICEGSAPSSPATPAKILADLRAPAKILSDLQDRYAQAANL